MTEWTKKKYNEYSEYYTPWLEDKYLAWFGENKTSYTAKENIKSTKVTGISGVDKLQDGVAEGVGGQFSKGGLLGGAGEGVSKEGFNRAERKDAGGLEGVADQERQKGWGETLSGGFLGGGGAKK